MGRKEEFKNLWHDHSVKEICKELNIARQTASVWRRDLGLSHKRRPFTREEDDLIKKTRGHAR